jgi:hypothetical protein
LITVNIAVALKSLVMLPIAVEDFNASSCASLESNLYLALSFTSTKCALPAP